MQSFMVFRRHCIYIYLRVILVFNIFEDREVTCVKFNFNRDAHLDILTEERKRCS